MKQCSRDMQIGGRNNCEHWNRICFTECGIFNDNGEMVGEEKAQWGYCAKLDKKFRYVLGAFPPCEPVQTTLM